MLKWNSELRVGIPPRLRHTPRPNIGRLEARWSFKALKFSEESKWFWESELYLWYGTRDFSEMIHAHRSTFPKNPGFRNISVAYFPSAILILQKTSTPRNFNWSQTSWMSPTGPIIIALKWPLHRWRAQIKSFQSAQKLFPFDNYRSCGDVKPPNAIFSKFTILSSEARKCAFW